MTKATKLQNLTKRKILTIDPAEVEAPSVDTVGRGDLLSLLVEVEGVVVVVVVSAVASTESTSYKVNNKIK